MTATVKFIGLLRKLFISAMKRIQPEAPQAMIQK